MRLLSPAIATALFALGTPALAGVDDAVHAKCLEARDYAGCVKTLSSITSNTQQKSEEINSSSMLIPEVCSAKDSSGWGHTQEWFENAVQEIGYDAVIRQCKDKSPPSKMSDKERQKIASTMPEACEGLDEDWFQDGVKTEGLEATVNRCISHKESKQDEELDQYAGGSEASFYNFKAKMDDYRQCPEGTSMITVDNRWNFLFFRGGKVKEIGCMSPQQLANFNAQVELGNREASRRIWRDAVNNMAADRRNQQLIDAVNQPVYCNTNSTTTGSVYGSGYGSADLYGSTSSSTSCY